jgi:hypothetical protein
LISYKEFRTLTPHEPFMSGDNLSFFVGGYFPKADLMKILRRGMSIPSDEVIAREFPTIKQRKGMIPFLTLYSRCNNVREHIFDVTVRPYLEINFFFPVTYTYRGEARLCSFMPLLYLDRLFHTIGGCMVGLRKQFHPNMKFTETDTLCSFDIENILSASFPENPMEETEEIDPFFAQIFTKPTLTYSYFHFTDFYTTQVFDVKKIYKVSADIEWNYKGAVIKNDEYTFCNFAEYSFTCSRAMSYKKYFHPKYPVDWKQITGESG